jgi:hypothetical protein
MRMVVVALVTLAVTGAHGAELLNSDFENLKNRLTGTWSFMENGQSYDATFEASLTVMLFWSVIRGLSPFIIPTVSTDCS